MLRNKDDVYLFRMLRITAFNAIFFLRKQESPVLNEWLDLVSKVPYGEDNIKLRTNVYILKRYVQL